MQDIRALVDKSHLKYSASHPIRIVETQKAPWVSYSGLLFLVLAWDSSSFIRRFVSDQSVLRSYGVLSQAAKKYCRLDGRDTRILAIICVSSTAAPKYLNCAAILSIPAMKFLIDCSRQEKYFSTKKRDSTFTDYFYLSEICSYRTGPTEGVHFQLKVGHILSGSCSTFRMLLYSLGKLFVFPASLSSR